MKIKNALTILLSLITLCCLNGCKEKGEDFVGSWYQLTSSNFPSEIKISYSDGVFHIDRNAFDKVVANEKYSQAFTDYMMGKIKTRPDRSKIDSKDSYRVTYYEATALNDNVLQSDGFSLRIENGKLKYKDEIYVKK